MNHRLECVASLYASNCAPNNFAGGNVIGGLISGGTAIGASGPGAAGCFSDRSRALNLRLTLKPFN